MRDCCGYEKLLKDERNCWKSLCFVLPAFIFKCVLLSLWKKKLRSIARRMYAVLTDSAAALAVGLYDVFIQVLISSDLMSFICFLY